MKTALVLSGGGARGAYEVGVWKALNELNINCDIVTGVSIGSINAALYAQGSLENAINLWKNISYNTVFPCDELPKTSKELRKKYFSSIRDGGAEPSNLKDNLLSCIDVDKIYESNIDYGLMTVKYPKIKRLELTKSKINKEDFVDYLIASSTIYPVFQVKEIEDEKYIDGGYINSVPFELAKKMGAEKYIIVNISVMKRRYKPKKDPNIVFIKPNNKLGSPIVFDSNIAKLNLEYGYNDTMKVFKKFYGKKYTFKDMNYKKNNIFNTYDKYINTLEYLGLAFGINDHLIYTIKKYNKILNEKINKISISEKLSLKDFNTRAERIIFVYNRLINNKVVRQNNKKRVINIEYRCAYYLYYNFYLKSKEN